MSQILSLILSFISGLYSGVALASLVFFIIFICVAVFDIKKVFDLTNECPLEFNEASHKSVSSNYTGALSMEESCKWLNFLLKMLLSSTEDSKVATLFREFLLAKLKMKLEALEIEFGNYLSGVNIEQFKMSRKTPLIGAIKSIPNETGGLDLAIDMEYRGEILLLISGNMNLGVGRISTKLALRHSSGKILLKFEKQPSSRVSFLISELPTYLVSIDRADTTLERISNLLSLIVSSLLKNHLVFPNFQPILLRPEATIMRDALLVPIWRSSRRFVRVELRSISLSDAVISTLQGNAVSVVVFVGKNRIKSETLKPSSYLPVRLSIQSSLGQDEVPTITVHLIQKRKKFAKGMVVFEANLPLDCVPTNVPHTMGIYAENDSASGCRVSIEILYNTDLMKITGENMWPLSKGLRIPTHDPEVLNGVDWNNIKMAWRRFRKSSSKLKMRNNDSLGGLQQQIEELIEVVAHPSNLLVTDEQNNLRSSLESLASDLKSIGPTANREEIEVAEGIFATHFPNIMKTYDQARLHGGLDQIANEMKSLGRSMSSLRSQYSFRSSVSINELDGLPLSEIMIGDSFELLSWPIETNSEELNICCKVCNLSVNIEWDLTRFSCRIFAESPVQPMCLNILLANAKGDGVLFMDQDLLSISSHTHSLVTIMKLRCFTELRLISNDRDDKGYLEIEISSRHSDKPTKFKIGSLDLLRLVSFLFSITKGSFHEFDLKRCIGVQTIAIDEKYFCLSISYTNEDHKNPIQVVVPLAIEHWRSIENVCKRSLFKLSRPLTIIDHLVSLPREDPSKQVTFHKEAYQQFGVNLTDSEVVSVSKCYLRKSLPLPGHVAFTCYGILFSSRVSVKKLFLHTRSITAIERILKWHSKGVSITLTDQSSYDFMQLSDECFEQIRDWCFDRTISWAQ